MRIVLFDRKKPKKTESEKRRKISADDIKRFHRSRVLKFFAFGNLAVAIFYSVLGTAGILAIMFMDSALGQRVLFSDMIELLERSLMHSIAAGAALIVDHIGHQISDIMRVQAAARLIEKDAIKRSVSSSTNGQNSDEKVHDDKGRQIGSKSTIQKFNEWLGVDESVRDDW